MSKYQSNIAKKLSVILASIAPIACMGERVPLNYDDEQQYEFLHSIGTASMTTLQDLASEMPTESVFGSNGCGLRNFSRTLLMTLRSAWDIYRLDNVVKIPESAYDDHEYQVSGSYLYGVFYLPMNDEGETKLSLSLMKHEPGHPFLGEHSDKIERLRRQHDNLLAKGKVKTGCDYYGRAAEKSNDFVELYDCLDQPYTISNPSNYPKKLQQTRDFVEWYADDDQEACELIYDEHPGSFSEWQQTIQDTIPDETYPKFLERRNLPREAYITAFQENYSLYSALVETFEIILGPESDYYGCENFGYEY
ncbi:hypothetical protein HOA92_00740 [archaeon]|nr:hypothetical protein [archaeon]MBT6761544.1 hypothetical protein [archaeon]